MNERWFLGTWLRVVADAETTGGALTVMEQRARKGFSPPLHVHRREDTALLVLAGELRVRLGEASRRLPVGEFVWLPRDVPHTFVVDSDEAHFLEFANPAGIERFHIDASDPAPGPELPPPGEPDIGRVIAALAPHDAEIIGPPMT